MKIGIIGGSGLVKAGLFSDYKKVKVRTPYGPRHLLNKGNIYYINRHGLNKLLPPHKINHKANIKALELAGVKHIIAFNSVGSLKKDLKPGTIVIPDDYINFFSIQTFFDKKIVHITPGLSEKLRRIIINSAKKLNLKVREKGVYFQTKGPRLETKAEIARIKQFAHIVGMTMANEATLAKESNIEYANISIVDNYAHGIVEEELSNEKIVKQAKKNLAMVEKLIEQIIKDLK